MSTSSLRSLLRRIAARNLQATTIRRWSAVTGRILPRATKAAAFQALAANYAVQTSIMANVEYLVYYGEPQASSHYNMWQPVFGVLPGKVVSVFRFATPWAPHINDDTVVPVALLHQCEALFARLPNLKAVFYPANNGLNLQAVRNTQCTHVFLGHGDSNKASSANKVFRIYDEVWVAGQAHIDRFKTVPGNYNGIDFRIVGQPWMQKWLQERQEYTLEQVVDWAYFPTWSGYYADTNYTSLRDMQTILNVSQRFTGASGQGYIKLHPWTNKAGQQIADDIDRANPNIHLLPLNTRLQSVLGKPLKFIICDISAALTECLYIDVPIFLYRPAPPAILNDDFEPKNAFCYIFNNANELEKLMCKVLENGDDYLATARHAALAYLVDIEKTRQGQFYNELERLSGAVEELIKDPNN